MRQGIPAIRTIPPSHSPPAAARRSGLGSPPKLHPNLAPAPHAKVSLAGGRGLLGIPACLRAGQCKSRVRRPPHAGGSKYLPSTGTSTGPGMQVSQRRGGPRLASGGQAREAEWPCGELRGRGTRGPAGGRRDAPQGVDGWASASTKLNRGTYLVVRVLVIFFPSRFYWRHSQHALGATSGRYAVRPRLRARGFSRRAGRQGQRSQSSTGLPSCLARTRSSRCR